MATEMQRKKITWPRGLLERKKKTKQKTNKQSPVFFDVIFYVYNHVDNRGSARETNFVGRKPFR